MNNCHVVSVFTSLFLLVKTLIRLDRLTFFLIEKSKRCFFVVDREIEEKKSR